MTMLLITLVLISITISVVLFFQLQTLKEQNKDQAKTIPETLGQNLKANREEFTSTINSLREELRSTLSTNKIENAQLLLNNSEAITTYIKDFSQLQKDQMQNFAETLKTFGEFNKQALASLNDNSRQDLQALRQTMETKIKNLQDENTKKLEEMRLTVDEKLQSTLEKRLDISFKHVSERLEKVHKGLGEMQNLATGVGDLKKVLTNVKSRGTWGEMQLASLLEEMLTPEQYQANVQVRPRLQERVDFAIKLPGQEESEPLWLPIDSKFPQEDYQRLLNAQELADPELADQAIKQLEARIKFEARAIRDKYIYPPKTTDFALMFLPTESLFAEVIRRPGLLDKLQREYRVNIVGPTTLAALLNSLQLGFRTLSIQKRSSEVWKLLGDIKKQFGTFGDLLTKAHEKVLQAGGVIEKASDRSRRIEAKLDKVQELPSDKSDSSTATLEVPVIPDSKLEMN